MNRADKALVVASAACLTMAGVLLVLAHLQVTNHSAVRNEPTERIEEKLGKQDFVLLFDAGFMDEKKFNLEVPSRSTSTDKGKADEQKVLQFADVGIPELVGGIRWKTCALPDLLKELVLRKDSLSGLELQLMMRGLVARLRTSLKDLDWAIENVTAHGASEDRRLLIIALGRTGNEKAENTLVALSKTAEAGTRELAILSLAQCGIEPYLNGAPDSFDALKYIVPEPLRRPKGRAAKILPELLATEKEASVLETLIGILANSQSHPRSSESQYSIG